jgi:hypothetical protein
MVLTAALGLLVVVFRYQCGNGLHQLAGEGGPVGWRREPHLAGRGAGEAALLAAACLT